MWSIKTGSGTALRMCLRKFVCCYGRLLCATGKILMAFSSSSPPLSIKLHPHARMICVEIHQHTHILTHSFILGMVQRNPRCPTISQHTPGEIVLESKSMLLHIESIRQVHWNNMTFAFCELCGQTSLSRHISCTTSSTCVTPKQTNFYLILVQIFKIFPRTFSITKSVFSNPLILCFLLLLLIDWWLLLLVVKVV